MTVRGNTYPRRDQPLSFWPRRAAREARAKVEETVHRHIGVPGHFRADSRPGGALDCRSRRHRTRPTVAVPEVGGMKPGSVASRWTSGAIGPRKPSTRRRRRKEIRPRPLRAKDLDQVVNINHGYG